MPATTRVDPKYSEHSNNSSAFASSDLPLNASAMRQMDCPPGLLDDFGGTYILFGSTIIC